MADFLTRLAAQTLGLATTAQPSIAPTFANSWASNKTFAANLLTEEGLAVEQEKESAAATPAHPATSTWNSIVPTPTSTPSPVAPLFQTRERVSPLVVQEQLIQSSAGSRPTAQTQRVQPLVEHIDIHRDSEAWSLQVHVPERQDEASPPQDHVLERPSEASLRVQDVQQTTVVREVRQQVEPLVTQMPSNVQQPTLGELTPTVTTIQVNIGRIDVRAVMPPTPPPSRPASTRPTPALSLDDYLRQQKGGRR